MSDLIYLVQHCTDTSADRPVSKEDIHQWHVVERGWSRLGYTDLFHQDGSMTNLTPFDQDGKVDDNEMTWGVKGFNSVSRHVVYAGGEDGDTRTPECKELMEIYYHYMVKRHPQIKICGHNQLDPVKKAFCPGFDVPRWCRKIGIPEVNIFVP